MTTIVRSVDVAVPPEEVWNVLSDFGGLAAWAPNVDHSCLLTERTEGRGTVRRIQTGRTTLVERVMVWDPPATLSYALEGLPTIVRSAINTWRVTGHDDGAHVSLASEVDAGIRPPQKVIARLVARRLAAASDDMLAGLKETLR